jgi:hypothetical protein
MPKATPPERRELEETLATLGLKRSTYRALMLLPLVYVAWADGKLEHVEVELILQFARARLHLTPDTMAVLERWLHDAPSASYVERGLQGLLRVALREDMLDVDVEELPDLLIHAEAIARATSDAFEDPSAVTPEEEVALAEIARLLEVDGGSTWKRVLDTVRTVRPPQ